MREGRENEVEGLKTRSAGVRYLAQLNGDGERRLSCISHVLLDKTLHIFGRLLEK